MAYDVLKTKGTTNWINNVTYAQYKLTVCVREVMAGVLVMDGISTIPSHLVW